MKYDCVKHVLTRDNGELVATLAPGVTTKEGYALADGFVARNEIVTHVDHTIDLVKDQADRILCLEEEVDASNKTIDEMRETIDHLKQSGAGANAAAVPSVPVGTEVAP